MAAGVQREEVWAAADALLSLGQRPTIEKVRQHIGRGSPNTVSPMLDQWFATLGARLGLAGASPLSASSVIEHSFPSPLHHAMQELWKAALRIADEHLQAKADALEARENALLERKRQLEDEKDVLSRTLPALHEQIAHLREQLQRSNSEVMQLTADKSREETEARGLRTKLREAQDALITQKAEADAQRADEVERHGKESRRMALEVDQARQSFKTASARGEDLSRELSQLRNDFSEERVRLNESVLRADTLEAEVRAQLRDAKEELEEAKRVQAVLREALRLAAMPGEVRAARPRPLKPRRIPVSRREK
ncbi:DNA-binding protein [Nostoc sp. CHAB 5834]|nr:DNA-binding protein [Nostoc sp. CHAB 5834]